MSSGSKRKQPSDSNSQKEGKGTLHFFIKSKKDDVDHPKKRIKINNENVSDSFDSMDPPSSYTKESPTKDVFDSKTKIKSNINSENEPKILHSSNPMLIDNSKEEESRPFFETIANSQKKQDELLSRYELWSERYRPKTFGDLLGNQVKVDALRDWLKLWNKIWKKKEEKKGRSKASDFQDKSAFIFGKPGIGKTTAARLIAESIGFKVIEFNASDTRSKNNLKEHVKELLDNNSLQRYNSISGKKKTKMCLIMDEVDGISSGDRGGITELINLIKVSKIPIICIANDGQDQKLKTLKSYSKVLQFDSPPEIVIFNRIKGICQKENVKITDEALRNLISSLDGDIRAVLSNLQFVSKQETKDRQTAISQDKTSIQKSSQIPNIFSMADCILKYSPEYPQNWQKMSNNEKKEFLKSCPRPLKQFTEYYFQDTLFIPLLIQQNYINMIPSVLKNFPFPVQESQRMRRIFSASESISFSDIIDRKIKEQQSWELAPLHGAMSTIVPSVYVRGSFQRILPYDPNQLRFPEILGKQSAAKKTLNELNDLSTCISTCGTANGTELALDGYVEMLDHKFGEILKSEDRIEEALDLMDQYHLSRADLDTIASYDSLIPSSRLSFKGVAANTKKALTKKYKSRFGGENILHSKKNSKEDDEDEDEEDLEPKPTIVKKSKQIKK